MNLHGKHSERGATMLASLCFATVAAISLSSYVAVSYNAMKLSAAQEQAISQDLTAANNLEATLHRVSTEDFSTWTVEGDTATQVVTDLDLSKLADSVPVEFKETVRTIPPPAKATVAKPDSSLDLFERINQRLISQRTRGFGFFSFSAPAPQPAPVVEEAPAPEIDPREVTMTLSGIGSDALERTLTLTQRTPHADGSIEERVLTAQIAALHPIHHAIVAQRSIRIRREGVIDSYDSSLGDYSDTNAGYDATLASRSIVVSRAEVRGFVSASGKNDPTFGSRARLTGPETPAKTAVDATRIVAYPYQPSLDPVVASGAGTLFSKVGSTLGTAGSTSPRIYYADEVALRDDQELTVVGPTILVVDRDFSISDKARLIVQADASLEIHVGGSVSLRGKGIENAARRPARVAVIGTGTAETSFLLATETPFHGVIYSPLAHVKTDGNDRDLFGAIVADRVTFDDRTDFHFDLDLKNAYLAGVETPFVFGRSE